MNGQQRKGLGVRIFFFFNSKAEAAENVTRTMKFGHLVSVNSYDLGTVRPNKLKCESLEKRRVYCRVMQRDWWLRHTKKIPQFLNWF